MKNLFFALMLLTNGLAHAVDYDFAGRVRTINDGLVVYNHPNIPYQLGISIGTGPKAEPQPGGGAGCIKWFTNDTPIYPQPEAYLQASGCLIPDPDPNLRRFKIEAIEQGTAYRTVTLSEGGGTVAIGTKIARAKLHVQSDPNSTGYIETIRIEGGSLANGWERAVCITGNDGSVSVMCMSGYLNGMDREARITVNGTLLLRIRQDGAVVIGTPAGGFMGTGSLNVQGGIFVNGTAH